MGFTSEASRANTSSKHPFLDGGFFKTPLFRRRLLYHHQSGRAGLGGVGACTGGVDSARVMVLAGRLFENTRVK